MAGTKTTLYDLNEYLFSTLDTLTNPDLSDEQLKKEVGRARAVSSIAGAIIANGKLVLDAAKAQSEYASRGTEGIARATVPLLGDGNGGGDDNA